MSNDASGVPNRANTTSAPGPAILRRGRVAVSAVFALQGMLLAMILSELPAIRNDLKATDALLAGIIGVVCLLAAAGSILAEKLAEWRDSATALSVGVGLLILGGLAIVGNFGLVSFLAAAGLYGVGVGAVDAAANMQAVSLQRGVGKVIMGSFFAAWSGGAIVGAVVASIGEEAQGNRLGAYRLSIACLLVVVLVVGLVARPHFLKRGHQPHLDLNPVNVVMPWRPVVLLGIAMALFFAIDFGLSNWSPLFLHDDLAASTSTAPLGVAAYQVAGFVTRLTTDFWTRRFGPVAVVRIGGALAVMGMAAVMLAPNVPVALVGLAVVGLGAPVIAPLCFSSAAVLTSHESLDVVIARLNVFNYVGTILGGVIIGAVLALAGARVSFVIPLLCAVAIILLARTFAAPRARAAGAASPRS